MLTRTLRKCLPIALLAAVPLLAQDRPWMNKGLSPEERADLVLKQMTLDEKIDLLHGNGMAHTENWQMPLTHLSNGGAGYVVGVPRLGIPPLYIFDAAYGVRSSGENGRYSTALPSNLGGAASSVRIWRADWPGAAGTGLQHDAGRRRRHHA